MAVIDCLWLPRALILSCNLFNILKNQLACAEYVNRAYIHTFYGAGTDARVCFLCVPARNAKYVCAGERYQLGSIYVYINVYQTCGMQISGVC